MHFKPHIYFEILCFLCCLIVFKQQRTSILKLFYIYLPVVLFTEISSYYIRQNHWVYNGFILFQFIIFSIFFYSIINKPAIKKLILFLMAVFYSFFFFNLFMGQGILKFNYYSVILLSLILIIFSGCFLLQIADEETTVSFWRLPFFWISVSCLLFFSGSFLYFSAWDALVNSKNDEKGKLYDLLFQVLNVIHYTTLSIGFLCTINIQKRSY